MRWSFAAVVAGIAVGCGGRAPPATDDTLGGIGDELPGRCIAPGSVTTRVAIDTIDRDAVSFCGAPVGPGDGVQCRKVELATGAMVEHAPRPPEPPLPQATAAIEAGELVACTGKDSCKRRPPDPGVVFDRAAIGGDQGKVAAATHVGDATAAAVIIYDQDLYAIAVAPITGPITEIMWLAGALHVATAAGGIPRGALYRDDGTLRGWVGGDATPLSIATAAPIQVGRTRYAWLAANAGAVALHDVRSFLQSRVELGIDDAGTNLAALGAMPQGYLVVVLGGTRFGDVVIVAPGGGEVMQRPATRCTQ